MLIETNTVRPKPHHHLESDVWAYGSFITSLDTRTDIDTLGLRNVCCVIQS